MNEKKKSVFIYIIEIISNCSLAIMFLSVMAGVISRYILKSPLFWTDELSRYLMIYMVFFGSALSFRADKHPSLTFIIDKLPKKWRLIWDLVIDLLLMAILVLLIWGALDMITSGPVGFTPSLRIKFTWVYWAIPLGSISMLIEIIFRLYRRIKNLSHSYLSPSQEQKTGEY
ncbi:putative 2,3-diketo-L-gulonate TRAP transporter small permease protein YiaM [uncultured spirochete]|jgi:TRAP-type C4-dicarboxylate transport system permease small subunit|uniref:Putative 2,3-diketo-L-gulonate TRAP transporter small permease protein YiaM n=1 Tax=uncultured spirochete TaxID=156406 RepID=A0A3P3XPD0_9SPIR|nr:putative 2,3-diketo-L-gulonate TRAP transporter small permease protein YiaM [uncultured spirochete]